MACLVNDFASFDTPKDPGGASIVERKNFQAKWPLCFQGLYVLNYRGEPPILRGGPPLGTISMDLAVFYSQS